MVVKWTERVVAKHRRKRGCLCCADAPRGADVERTGSDQEPKPHGFAALSQQALQELGSQGGTKALENGTLHQFTPDDHRRGGQAGGRKVSSDRAHMSKIGKMGAAALKANRERARESGTQE